MRSTSAIGVEKGQIIIRETRETLAARLALTYFTESNTLLLVELRLYLSRRIDQHTR